jgi:hypothetical protein
MSKPVSATSDGKAAQSDLLGQTVQSKGTLQARLAFVSLQSERETRHVRSTARCFANVLGLKTKNQVG